MFVSVITSTRGRRRFIPRLIEMYKGQTYPKEKMEWILLDDGLPDERVSDLVSGIPGVRYLVSDVRLTMGEKLNRLNKAVTLRSDCIVVSSSARGERCRARSNAQDMRWEVVPLHSERIRPAKVRAAST